MRMFCRLAKYAMIPGKYDQWRNACLDARRSGWTYGQVNVVLLFFNPISCLLWLILIAAVLTAR
jgi:hypothetical protein